MIRTPRDVGALIRDRRTAAGLDQAALARRAGVSRLWISEVEHGKPGASIGRILRTLDVLGIELQPKSLADAPTVSADHRPDSSDLIRRVLDQIPESEGG